MTFYLSWRSITPLHLILMDGNEFTRKLICGCTSRMLLDPPCEKRRTASSESDSAFGRTLSISSAASPLLLPASTMAFCVMYNVLAKNRPSSLELPFTADSDSIY